MSAFCCLGTSVGSYCTTIMFTVELEAEHIVGFQEESTHRRGGEGNSHPAAWAQSVLLNDEGCA